MPERCDVRIGGLFRCCIDSIPTDEEGYALAGTEGEIRLCVHSENEEGHDLRFIDGAWEAKWIRDECPNTLSRS